MKIVFPNAQGHATAYTLTGTPVQGVKLPKDAARVVYSAAHVVRDPYAPNDPTGRAAVDWDATMAFRGHLTDLGLGIAEAMDTAQRGMGLDWSGALELIRQTKTAYPDALVANGCGTDHLDMAQVTSLDQVRDAYLHQIEAIQNAGGRIILMASRALAKLATGPEDYTRIYADVLAACDQPVILHWLGEMFDPALQGYWGHDRFEDALPVALDIIKSNQAKVDGIKISLLDADKEVIMRRALPEGVRMYTGDDFNYPDLIRGDAHGFSHALLGAFDPIAAHASAAIHALGEGDTQRYHQIIDPTVRLARHIFQTPTMYYKTGVVFLAWLNGHQQHFRMLGGHEAMRSLPHLIECFKLADACGALSNPDLAVRRMTLLLQSYGFEG